MFFRIFQHLLPASRAWNITPVKFLRDFFTGLTGLGSDSKTFIDEIWEDIDPEVTRQLDEWEKQFGLLDTLPVEQDRRDRLAGAWQALGDQDPRYIQDVLQANGFQVFLHEFWELPRTTPPTVRNPLLVLRQGVVQDFASQDGDPNMQDGDPLAQDGGQVDASTAPIFRSVANDGGADMQDGDPLAQDGGILDLPGYPLVNKLFVPFTSSIGDGSIQMQDGGAEAMDGFSLTAYNEKSYIIPTDSAFWPYFLYIGGVTYPDLAQVSNARKNEFESLCLKLAPSQQWLGILVEYT